jgi:hypothetical protein
MFKALISKLIMDFINGVVYPIKAGRNSMQYGYLKTLFILTKGFIYYFLHFRTLLKSIVLALKESRIFLKQIPNINFISKNMEIINLIKSKYNDEANKILERALKILSHKFYLFGEERNLDKFLRKGEYLPWNYDFKFNFYWDSRSPSEKIKIFKGKGDLRIAWELSRFYHLVTLGQAYWLTGDERYTREFMREVINWIDTNPVGYGINWISSMEVGIRAFNWILAWEFFKDSKILTLGFKKTFFRNLFLHGRFIIKNLEWNSLHAGNHYLSNLASLIILGILFRETREGKLWVRYGLSELKKEVRRQVYEDGMNFEASTSYHRFVLELIFYTVLICERNGIVVPQEIKIYLKKMFNFLRDILKPNGRIPQLGDNDSSRFITLSERNDLDHTYLISLGAVYFKNSRLKPDIDLPIEVLWLWGEEGYRIWNSLPPNGVPLKSKGFPISGFYVMRNQLDYVSISCVPNGQNSKGGHSHNDKLSFELCVKGEDIFVDPGTFIYTQNIFLRNYFRSTSMHNTVQIDGEEQNRYIKDDIFRLFNDSYPRCIYWESDKKIDIFVGEHYGYKRLKFPIVHRRKIIFLKSEGTWLIEDFLFYSNKPKVKDVAHHLNWYFHLSPHIEIEFSEESEIVFYKYSQRLAKMLFDSKLKFLTLESWYSPSYGIKEKSKCLNFQIYTSLPFNAKFIIKSLC